MESELDEGAGEDMTGFEDPDDAVDHSRRHAWKFSRFKDGALSPHSTKAAASSKLLPDDIDQELNDFIWSTGSLFADRGWELVHVRSPDRYTINGRPIRIFLLP